VRLERLHIAGFKALVDVQLELRPFTVLVGPNGGGKSSILQAVDLLGGLVRGSISEYLEGWGWEYADLPHLRSASSRISFTAVLDGAQPLKWILQLGARRYAGISAESVHRLDDRAEVLSRRGREMWRLNRVSGERESIRQTLPSSWISAIDPRLKQDRAAYPELARIHRWAAAVKALFFLDPLALRAPSRGAKSDIGRHGEDLAAFLGALVTRDPTAFRRLVDRVRQYYPRLKGIKPRRTRYGWTHLEIEERANGGAYTFNARQISDGLLRLIAVSAMHELERPPSVLLLDEIENGLHPRLLGAFVGSLQELANSGTTQVIVTTHSPITLNYVEDPSSILVVYRDEDDGGTNALPLSGAKRFEKLRAHFDLGELWYNAGEERLVR
jgi:predicted ATPase